MALVTRIARRLRRERGDDWADERFRARVGAEVDAILAGDVPDGAKRLWSLALGSHLGFAQGLWLIWGAITDEHTHSAGDPDEGDRLAVEAARDLRPALGDPDRESAMCDHWIYERLSIDSWPDRLGEAIVVWTGHHAPGVSWPDLGAAGEARLRERYGDVVARHLLTEVRRAADDFNASDAWRTAPDLSTMSTLASAEFRTRRPELPEAAVEALAWYYTFGHR